MIAFNVVEHLQNRISSFITYMRRHLESLEMKQAILLERLRPAIAMNSFALSIWYTSSPNDDFPGHTVLFDCIAHSYRSELFAVALSGVTQIRRWVPFWICFLLRFPHDFSWSFSLPPLPVACSLGINFLCTSSKCISGTYIFL